MNTTAQPTTDQEVSAFEYAIPAAVAALVEKAREKWPDRIAELSAAARIVTAGKVWQTGETRYRIDDPARPGSRYSATVDHAAHACTCSEPAAEHPKLGRLCRHRIAVMFYRRLSAWLGETWTQALAAAPDTLTVIVDCPGRAAPKDRYSVIAFRDEDAGATHRLRVAIPRLPNQLIGDLSDAGYQPAARAFDPRRRALCLTYTRR